MSTPTKTGKTADKPAETATGKRPRKPRRKRSSLAIAVEKMMRNFNKRLDKDEPKVSVGDFIRLVQLNEEMQVEEPREIRVTWVEPEQTESTNGT